MLDDAILSAQQHVEHAQTHHTQIRQAMIALERAGMYPALPTEQWQTRNGNDNQYLYMIFSTDGNGDYTGPDGKRKIYIGNKPANIAEAQRLARNRARWEDLERESKRLAYWISGMTRKIQATREAVQHLPVEAKQWPPSPTLEQLGDSVFETGAAKPGS